MPNTPIDDDQVDALRELDHRRALSEAGGPPRNGGSRPVPDPTELTDRAIAKAVEAIRDYIDGQLAVRDERLSGIDEATKLRVKGVDDVPNQIALAVTARAALVDEKFVGVQRQFEERDEQADRESALSHAALDSRFLASKEAISAALIAAKESAAEQNRSSTLAISKSEAATAETIKTNQELNRATTDALTKSLDEAKSRITVLESTKLGATEQRTTGIENRTGIYATIGIGITIILAAITIVGILMASRPV